MRMREGSLPVVENGLVHLEAQVWLRTAEGRVPVLMQDLGLPIGEREARDRIEAMGADEGAAIWIPDRDAGWLVIMQAAPVP